MAADVEERFSFHKATEVTGPMHDKARRIFADAATKVLELVPDGREQSLVLTKLEEGMFWANAGIARHG